MAQHPEILMSKGGIVIFKTDEDGKPRDVLSNVDSEALQNPEQVLLWTMCTQQADIFKELRKITEQLTTLNERAEKAAAAAPDVNAMLEGVVKNLPGGMGAQVMAALDGMGKGT